MQKNLANLKSIMGLSLTEAFFELYRRRGNVWQVLTEIGYGKRDYFDFTDRDWIALSVKKQLQYASEYQNWYAEQLNYGVEHPFNGMTFRLIPPGKYLMGSPLWERGRYEDEKLHKVFIHKPFWCGKYEITQQEWVNAMGSNPSLIKGENHPVENVSWEDISEFCDHTDTQLPSEEQWEYACRGGTLTAYNFGDDELELPDYAYYKENSKNQTHSVGEKLPNSFGLYDMHGNVWEWTSSFYDNSFESRSCRGGAFGSSVVGCRSASVMDSPDSWHSGARGFRVSITPCLKAGTCRESDKSCL